MEFRVQLNIWGLYILSSYILFVACIMIHGWNLTFVGCVGLWCRDIILHLAKSQV
jgi:hypothetical protein